MLSVPRLAGRLRLEPGEPELLLAALLSQAEVVPGVRLPGVTRDPKDDALVACAREGGAQYLVSGDQDLLAMGQCEGIQAITPRRFADILGLAA